MVLRLRCWGSGGLPEKGPRNIGPEFFAPNFPVCGFLNCRTVLSRQTPVSVEPWPYTTAILYANGNCQCGLTTNNVGRFAKRGFFSINIYVHFHSLRAVDQYVNGE